MRCFKDSSIFSKKDLQYRRFVDSGYDPKNNPKFSKEILQYRLLETSFVHFLETKSLSKKNLAKSESVGTESRISASCESRCFAPSSEGSPGRSAAVSSN